MGHRGDKNVYMKRFFKICPGMIDNAVMCKNSSDNFYLAARSPLGKWTLELTDQGEE